MHYIFTGGEVGQILESSIMKGFVATLNPEQLQSFRSLQDDKIEYIGAVFMIITSSRFLIHILEKDGEVKIQ